MGRCWSGLGIVAALAVAPAAAGVSHPGSAPVLAPERVGVGVASGDWVVADADNVCGLTDARQLKNPAVVDYDALLDATPEVQEMKRKGIDRDTPRGQVLYNKAVDRVRNAAADVMKDKGYDSIWKTIKHKQGKKAPDATDEIKRLL
jgi:hypothetical protein